MALFPDTDRPAPDRPYNGGKHTDILTIYPDPAKQNAPPKKGPGRPAAHQSRDVTMKHAAFAILRDAGAGPSQAAKVLGLHPSTGSNLEKKLNAYEIERDKLLSKAVKTVKNFVQGRPVGQVVDPSTGQLDPKSGVHPKGSDVMRAVELVMDREQPKVTLSASVTAEFLPVDLSAYE